MYHTHTRVFYSSFRFCVYYYIFLVDYQDERTGYGRVCKKRITKKKIKMKKIYYII